MVDAVVHILQHGVLSIKKNNNNNKKIKNNDDINET